MALIRYLDMSEIGAWFNTSADTVSKWRTRYQATLPCPEPDAMTGRTPGWLPDREAAWRRWEESRPGRGSGGGRPHKASP